MKKLLLLLVAMFMALGALGACSSAQTKEPEQVVLEGKAEDALWLIDVSDVDIVNKTIKLADGTLATYLSDIDLSLKEAQKIKVRYVNSEGKEVVEEVVVYFGEKQELNTLSESQEKLHELLEKPKEVSNPQADDYAVEIPEEEDVTETTNTASTNSGNSNSGSGSNSNSGSTSQSSSNQGDQGGSSQFPDAQAFVDWLNSTYGPQSCNTAVNMWYNRMGGRSGLNGYETTSPQYGDTIIYYDANGNYMHTAIYLGNGMAMHGNYTSNGTAKIASINLYSSHKYFHHDPNGTQTVDIYGKIIDTDTSQQEQTNSQNETNTGNSVDEINNYYMSIGAWYWYNSADGNVYYDDEKMTGEEFNKVRSIITDAGIMHRNEYCTFEGFTEEYRNALMCELWPY